MSWAPGLSCTLAFGTTAVFAVVALVGWRHRDERAAGAFVGLTAAFGLWTFWYGIRFGYASVPSQLPWWRLGLATAGFVVPMWVLFGLRYAGKDDWITPNAILVLFAEPTAFVAVLYTNASHELVWSSLSFRTAPVPTIVPVLEPLYYLHITYHYGLVAFGTLLVAGAAYHSMGLYRRQAAALVVAAMPPIVASLTYTVGSSPVPDVDLTPVASLLTVVGIAVAKFEFDLLDRTPIAREQALEEAGGGLLVLDTDEVVVDADERAQRVIDASGVVGKSFAELFPDTSVDGCSGRVVETQDRNGRRYYELRATRLRDSEHAFAGYSVVFRDVTDRRAYEQRLEVANRVLRHNLRNDMNLVQGIANRIESGESTDLETDARLIRQRADRVVELGEKARVMTRTDPAASVSSQTVDLTGPALQVLETFEAQAHGVRFESHLTESLPAVVTDESALRTALQELVENAVEHNDTDDPLVRIEGERRENAVFLRVVDNGPGVPKAEQEVLQSGTETPLHHGGGMGLWLAYWSTQAAGGELSIEQCTEAGSVIELRFSSPED